MPNLRRALPLLAAAALLAAACGGDPAVTGAPSPSRATAASATPAATEVPFVASSWPAAGTACDDPGYGGLLGRIEAPDAATVRFTLCRPDGAFRTRLAHPALAILDTTTMERLAADRSSARTIAGAGAYRIARWVDGDNVLLERVAAEPSPAALVPTVVLRWAGDASARTAALEDATVDGIDDPGAAELAAIGGQPELVVTPRAGLATAFLAFGAGPAFAGARVRRAIAASLDRAQVTAAAFPPGSVVPTHTAPCVIPGGCVGSPWYEFNGPAAAAVLADETFDLGKTYELHVPDRPVPGLPDPAAAAEAVKAQLAANIGMTVSVDVMPAEAFRAAVDDGTLAGMYLDGVETSLPDATGILVPLFGEGVRTTPARRLDGVAAILDEAAATPGTAARTDAITRANDAIRSAAVIVPLAHPGAAVAYRGDVAGVVTSPLGLDPLGATTPGDRPQLAFMQATEPEGAYCGDQASQDALRLCGMVSEGLYGFGRGELAPKAQLARACNPNEDATVWTCLLRPDARYSDGMRVDAGDVVASFVAQWDRSQPLRAAEPAAVFAAWDELFGGTLGGG